VPLSSGTILVAGDSHAQFSGRSLEQFCLGQRIVNRGTEKAMAEHWAFNGTGYAGNRTACPRDTKDDLGKWDLPGCVCSNGWGSCRPSDLFHLGSHTPWAPSQPTPTNLSADPYTRMWLAIGGKDFISAGCRLSRQELAGKISSVLSIIHQAAPANFTVLMTGDCTPTTFDNFEKWWGPTCNLTSWPTVNEAIADAVSEFPGFATFVDATSLCGGGIATLSPGKESNPPQVPPPYHVADPNLGDMHYNNRGYCKIFTAPGVQEALGCGAAAYDCDSVDLAIPCAPGQSSPPRGCGSEPYAQTYAHDPQDVAPLLRSAGAQKHVLADVNVGRTPLAAGDADRAAEPRRRRRRALAWALPFPVRDSSALRAHEADE